MVRLRVSCEFPMFYIEEDFNSNMVRLRVIVFQLPFVQKLIFQFQYGAIKSYSRAWFGVIAIRFQFQYGAIKSFRHVFHLHHHLHFNSNMVRLRVHKYCTKTSSMLFQFQYGAIKREVFVIAPLWLIAFQFQYGAIKRSSRLKNHLQDGYFNSNMVRLRECNIFRKNECITISIPIWCD